MKTLLNRLRRHLVFNPKSKIPNRKSKIPSPRRPRFESLENRSLLAVIASDGFESGDFAGGTGWASGWTVAGGTNAMVVSSSAPHSGTYHAQLRSSTGDLQRAVDISALTDVHLQFWSKVNSFEGSDKALVSVSPNGSTWTTLLQLNKNQSDNQYHAYDLSVPTSGNSLYIRFDAAMSAADDYWFLDDVVVVGTPSIPPPPPVFNFTDFSDSSALSLLGDAAITPDHRLRLTPAAGGQEGAAWYTLEKQYVGVEFSTTFQFQMADNFDAPGGSDGFVFLIQNFAPTFLAGGGGTLGYYGLPNSLAVEFDTFQNSEVSDPSGSHISVHTNGTGPNDWRESLSLGSYNTNPILDDALVHTAKITYSQKTLSIFLDNLSTPKLTVSVDLADKLSLDAGRAWIGFTGTTGGGYQTHDILNWSFGTAIPATTLSIGDASVVEGSTGTSNLVFTVTRSGDLSAAATVNWNAQDGTATAASGDYVAAAGQLSFAANEFTQQLSVAVNGDTSMELHETLTVALTDASGAVILDGTGLGTILTDETTISISDTTATEGGTTIQFIGDFASSSGGIYSPYSLAYSPDGSRLYVSSLAGSSVLRYDAASGAPLPAPGKPGAEFVSPGAGGLQLARSIAFGPDGNLCVVSENSSAVLRFDSITGEPLSPLVLPGSGGLDQPRGLLFHPDGDESHPYGYLYVTSVGRGEIAAPGLDSILRYDAITGEPAGTSEQPGDAVFIASGSGGLDNPSDIVFENGNFYVASTSPSTSNSVLKFAPDGTFLGAFVPTGSGGLAGPADITFHDGYLYVASWTNSQVLRYDGATGVFAGTVVSGGGLATPLGLLFEPSGNLLVTSRDSNQIRRYGPASQAAFTVSLSSPSAVTVTVDYDTSPGSADTSDFSGSTGRITFAPGQTSQTILVQTINDDLVEGNESFFVNLTNPSDGAVRADSQGSGTILDDELISYLMFSSVGDYVSMSAIAHDAQGNTYISGLLESPSSAGTAGPVDFDPAHTYGDSRDIVYDASPHGSAGFIAKYDAAGQFVWVEASTSLLDQDGVPHAQSSGYSEVTITSLEISASGNVYFAGRYTGSSEFGGQTLPWTKYNGHGDRFIGMIKADGTLGWLKGYDFAESEGGGQLAIDEANQRAYLLGSQMLTSPGIPSARVTALNVANASNITIAWDALLQPKATSGMDAAYAGDITLDRQGSLIVVGSLIGDADFDPTSGTLNLSGGTGRFDRPEAPFIWKLTSQGALVWAQLFEGGKAKADRVAVDSANNIYVGGSFSDTVDFQWGKAALKLTSGGGKDAYIAKLTPTGTTLYAKKFGSGSDDFLSDLVLDAQGNIYVSITHWASEYVSTGASILKLDNSGTVIGQTVITERIAQFSRTVSISLAPNGKLSAVGSFIGPLDLDSDGTTELVGQQTGYDWEFDGFWVLDVGL